MIELPELMTEIPEFMTKIPEFTINIEEGVQQAARAAEADRV
jgi:hypothetical protein